MAIDDMLNFMALIQAMMLVNFSFVYLSEQSYFLRFQSEFYEWFKKLNVLKIVREWSLRRYRIVRKDSPSYLLERKQLLSSLYNEFKATMNWERASDHFIPLGLSSGLYCLAYMIFVPLWKNSDDFDYGVGLFESFVVMIYILDVIFFYWSYRKLCQTRVAYIMMTILFMLIGSAVVLILYCYGLTITCPINFKQMVYISLLIPFAPIITYIVMLLFACCYRLRIICQMTVNTWALQYLKRKKYSA